MKKRGDSVRSPPASFLIHFQSTAGASRHRFAAALRAPTRRDALFFRAFPLRFNAPTFVPTARRTFFTNDFTLRVAPPRFAAAFRFRVAIESVSLRGKLRQRSISDRNNQAGTRRAGRERVDGR